MSASPVINGVPVVFGFDGPVASDGSQGITITGLTGTLIQSADQTRVADVERIKDGRGNEVVHAWANLHDEASLEWVIAGSTLTGAISNITAHYKSPGTILAISGCTSMPSLIGTCWEVQSGVKVSGSNVGAKKITFPIHAFPGITATAT
jgi:hypothetical protein